MPSEAAVHARYMAMFNRFFKKHHMSSTYKPVFLRSLLDIGDYNPASGKRLVGEEWLEHKDGRLLVDLNFIASRFAKYYWDMQYSFRLRQTQVGKEAVITQIIGKEHRRGDAPPALKKIVRGDMDSFRKSVIRRAIKPDVLPRLHNDMQGLYTILDSDAISLDENIVGFIRANKTVLQRGIIGVLAKYLEKINQMTPQISNKVERHDAPRPLLSNKHKNKLNDLQDSKCFYCNDRAKSPHTDHVIPYNFIFSTDLYNCAISCQTCNCEKSDTLPAKKYFDHAVKRNKELCDYMEKSNIFYNEDSYKCLFDMCVSDYNGRMHFFKPSKPSRAGA